ncbi:restriction endonuclease subunit S [Chromobacterium piscinae]|uniref:restriction endonuclease subunit S n=1 Tax=Chromobacterium piscinae TaxID=686831 RepID=UPI003209FF20
MQRYESYKPSNAAWLGDVPSLWDVQPLRAVTSLKSDKNRPDLPVLSVYREYGVILKNSRDDNHNATSLDTSNYKVVKPGDLVVNKMKAWQGSMGVSAHHGVVSPAYITCTTKADRVRPAYLHYLLRSLPLIGVYNSLSYGVRVGQWDMHYEDFKQIPIPLPPKDEQDRIVAFLDQKTAEIDAAIAKKERLIELLQEQKNIRIHQAVLRGLNPEVPLCNSGVTWIGAVPAHWKVIPNRYIFREQNARSLRGEETHLSMSQRYGLVPAKELDVQTLQSESYDGAKLCQKGDLVQNRLKAHLAVFAVAPCDGLVSPDYSVFRLQNAQNQPVYFERLFKTPNYLGEFNRRVRGIVVGFLRLYSEDFNAIPALVPPCDEQTEIVRFIEATNKEFEEIWAKIDAEIVMLRELKVITVASAVTGKIKV